MSGSGYIAWAVASEERSVCWARCQTLEVMSYGLQLTW